MADDSRVFIQFENEGFVNPIITSKIPRLEPGQLASENAGENQTHWYGFSAWQQVQSTVPSSHHDEICSGIRSTK